MYELFEMYLQYLWETRHGKRKQQSTITALFGCSTSSKKAKPDDACELRDGKESATSEVGRTDRIVLDSVQDDPEDKDDRSGAISPSTRTTRIPGRETPVSRQNFTGADELIL